MHFHGGGFALGSIASSAPLCRALAHQAGVRVLSVEYRLAPEHPFPAGLADAASALHHVLTHRDEFRATTVAVGGDSAGANLALTAAHQLARRDLETASFVLALYPVTDAGRSGGSRETFAEGFGLRTVDIEVFERYYLPDGIEPIRPTGLLEVDDLAIMPPCYVATAGFDPLRDEGEELAEALRAARRARGGAPLPGPRARLRGVRGHRPDRPRRRPRRRLRPARGPGADDDAGAHGRLPVSTFRPDEGGKCSRAGQWRSIVIAAAG